ncbi:GDSL-type esterase/lipase family protein [Leadbettera azotonutricia]|uniref:GDSL-type esterase/lipase family protein n=1 Tax=Leadbettera azotonutricia TaxID=150829 RepID=UPI0003061BF1|nr:GDSL-type esterase/lipase family protein [Leadbettera azotonutricia]
MKLYKIVFAGLCVLTLFTVSTCEFEYQDESVFPIPVVSKNDPAVSESAGKYSDNDSRKDIHDSFKNMAGDFQFILLGDDIIAYWDWDDMPNSSSYYNFGISGDDTANLIWRLKDGELSESITADYVVLHIGVNNVKNWQSAASVAAGIGEIIKLINKKLPYTQILLFSVLPYYDTAWDDEEEWEWDIASFMLSNIQSVNNIISKYDGFYNTSYIDVASSFFADGVFYDELFEPDDGYYSTPTAEGYGYLYDEILAVLSNSGDDD